MLKSKHPFVTLGVLAFCGALGSATLSAATVYVGNCGGTPKYATIQAAVNASSPGGTVDICPGPYPEQVTITKNLTVTGIQAGTMDAIVITSPGGGVVQNTFDLYMPPSFPVAAQVLVQNANNVMLSNIVVDGSNNGISGCGLDLRGIYYQNASGMISDVVTRNQELSSGLTGCQSGQGIFVQGGYGTGGTAKVNIQNNSVHSFQKNGITVDGDSANGNVMNNYISGQGPTTGAAENGIQISDGAAGNVTNNVVIDDIWAPDTSSDTGDAASGILVYASQNVTIQNNTVGTTQFGIVTVSDPKFGVSNNPMGLGDHTNINNNQVLNTKLFDAIDVCSNNNNIQNNTLSNSTESGIHLDSSCGSSGENNHVSNNTIIESCAGILVGASPNTIGNDNKFYGVANTISAGNTCSSSSGPSAVSANALTPLGAVSPHPSPAR
jgi:parallel beta-helix repeat protein